ncbi:MAG: dihydroneopterin aldolase [Actinomycetota bacterium]|nr:MAG: dihydroneopterin aldolase [Actinomycetota bacterium]
MDVVRLLGVRARGHHGVLAHERRDGQEFVVDAVLGLDTRPAAAADDLALTVDYGALAADLVAAVQRDPVDLIETLAARLVAVCLLRPAVVVAEISVHKPQAPIPVPFADVVVTVRRSRTEPDDAGAR